MPKVIQHEDVIKWKNFPRYWPFVRGIHRSPLNSPHKGQWSEALMFSLIWAWINRWVNNCEAVDLRRHRAHYDVIVNKINSRCPLTGYPRMFSTQICMHHPRILYYTGEQNGYISTHTQTVNQQPPACFNPSVSQKTGGKYERLTHQRRLFQ